jgi:uncharacterized protein YndB with AHSA1/START domain
MEEATVRKSVSIDAAAGKVWEVLLEPRFTKEWGGEFMEGCYVESDWNLGSEVIWKDGDGTPFVSGVVSDIWPESLLIVGFYDDVSSRPPEPPGEFKETYALSEEDGRTILSIIAELGPVDEETFNNASSLWDNALQEIKELSES